MKISKVEWPTAILILVVYLGLHLNCLYIYEISSTIFMILLAFLIALHSSISHEILHGHPTKNDFVNSIFVFPAVGIFIPFLRFKDTHLEHHKNENLTDPYDDPETNFIDPNKWENLRFFVQFILNITNTLLGRMLIGPVISQYKFIKSDIHFLFHGNKRVLLAWILHIFGFTIAYYFFVLFHGIGFGHWIISAYAALSILKIRTFLEHRAFDRVRGRSVIIEDRGILSLIFLNNNFHAVHHMHPKIPWYKLPRIFKDNKRRYLALNEYYYFKSYLDIFKTYFFISKDPVAHPYYPRQSEAYKNNKKAV